MSRQRGAEYRAGGWVWTGGSRHEVDFFDPRSRHHIQLEIVADDRAPEERPGAVLPGVEPEADADGVSGQDRDSYADDQDRDSYADDQDRDSYTAPAEATAAEAFPIDRVWVAVEQSRIYAHCIGVGVTLLAATKLAEDHAAQCGHTRERWRDERHPELAGETLHAYRIGETGARVEYRYRVLPYDIAGRA
jgi:hypothetical protein